MIYLLVMIYLSFIGLGLPDSILGSAWPVMQAELQVPLSGAGLVTMIVTAGTILSSLNCQRILKLLGAGKVTAVSTLLTAAALFGFSRADSFLRLCLMAVPLGLGAGAVDSVLNHFVSVHYSSRHMNWLHCFWGLGATGGPMLMSLCLSRIGSWQGGYLFISVIQFALAAVLFLSLPVWKRAGKKSTELDAGGEKRGRQAGLLSVPGILPVLWTFYAYCAIELGTGLWSASYLTEVRGVPAVTAARWTSCFYLGITVGRFLSGLISDRMGDWRMVSLGQGLILAGVVLLLLPGTAFLALAGILLIGLGCAPIYPSMLHATPKRFGEARAAGLMGLQMAVAYSGSLTIPLVMGVMGGRLGMGIYPFAILLLILLLWLGNLRANQRAPM